MEAVLASAEQTRDLSDRSDFHEVAAAARALVDIRRDYLELAERQADTPDTWRRANHDERRDSPGAEKEDASGEDKGGSTARVSLGLARTVRPADSSLNRMRKIAVIHSLQGSHGGVGLKRWLKDARRPGPRGPWQKVENGKPISIALNNDRFAEDNGELGFGLELCSHAGSSVHLRRSGHN